MLGQFVSPNDLGKRNSLADFEATNYVGNIYKYYLAYKMTTEQNGRRQASRSASAPTPAK